MRIYKLVSICTSIILLSGCATKTKETSSDAASKVAKNDETVVLDTSHKEKDDQPIVADITQKEKGPESIRTTHPIEIDEEITSPIGESQSYFTYDGNVPFKISLTNTGTESFIYKIRNVDKETKVLDGVLKSNEGFDHVFEGLPEGAYVIYCVVEEEEPPVDIKLKVKVELLPKIL
ncbi:hypothetical protein LSPCS325_13600 [Lysinibacillus sp. CTST325]